MAARPNYCTAIFFWVAAAAALVQLLISSAGAAAPAPAKAPSIGMPGCDTRCGNLSVPYPFGMGPSRCYHSPGFNLTCDRGRLLLGDGTFQVSEEISPSDPVLTVVHAGDVKTDSAGRGTFGGDGLRDDGPYALSAFNQLVLVGCNVRATLRNGNVTMGGCSSLCDDGSTSYYMPSALRSSMLCSGIGCCQAPIVVNREVLAGSGQLVPITSYDLELEYFGWNRSEAQQWPARVFVARNGWFAPWGISQQLSSSAPAKNHGSSAVTMAVPVWLDWEVSVGSSVSASESEECPREAAITVCKSNHSDCTRGTRGGYTCSCKDGYQGNPYIANGCHDIDECKYSEDHVCFGQCINTYGSFQCRCPPGTRGDPYKPGGCFSLLTSNCITSCGNISVPYPFGIGHANCYMTGFNLTCDTSHHPPRLMLGRHRIVDISLHNNTMRVINTDQVLDIHSGIGKITMGFAESTGHGDTVPYSLSTQNELILIGCGVHAVLSGDGNPAILSGCASFCSVNENGTYSDATMVAASEDDDTDEDKYCYGMGCCQARVSMSTYGMPSQFWMEWMDVNSAWDEASPHSYAFIAEEGWFRKREVSAQLLKQRQSRKTYFSPPRLEVPIVLDWEILQLQPRAGSPPRANMSSPQKYLKCPGICRSKNSLCRPRIRGYSCRCTEGYDGNPYLADGCKGGRKYFKGIGVVIGFAAGFAVVLLFIITFLISNKVKYRRAQIMKRKFFKQNRGQLLQQLVSQNADIAERMIISLEELEKATNNFDKARELGRGGHSTVYKGILSDLQVVAIKKPKKVIQKEIDEFINEVAILSQINHRNVVKLYCCCLETEVPMLVYEFISNGTLHGHLHVQGPKSLSWDDRLRIAIETSKSIAYLHSTTSIPIIHRDIKSLNILLDDTLTAKVADFGASRYVPVDRSGVTTKVQGTIGYMDPLYFYTGRLTEKSDVYGFGVMLVELLTRQKPFSYLSSQGDGLVAHFCTLYAEGNFSQILDPQVMEEGGKRVDEVVAIAVACIKLTAEDRPTMRQVELALENVQSPKHIDNVVAEKSEKIGTSIGGSWIKDGKGGKESTRQYSMERAFEISATYPR